MLHYQYLQRVVCYLYFFGLITLHILILTYQMKPWRIFSFRSPFKLLCWDVGWVRSYPHRAQSLAILHVVFLGIFRMAQERDLRLYLWVHPFRSLSYKTAPKVDSRSESTFQPQRSLVTALVSCTVIIIKCMHSTPDPGPFSSIYSDCKPSPPIRSSDPDLCNARLTFTVPSGTKKIDLVV